MKNGFYYKNLFDVNELDINFSKNREKCYSIMNEAISKKYIKNSSICELCGSKFHIVAHHEDYKFPLLIKWVCKRCHSKIHQTPDFNR